MACCDVCGEVFTLKFNLNVHIKNKHSEVGQGSLINCNECEYVAVNSNMNQLKNISHKAYDIEKIRYFNFICKNPNVKKK